MININEAYFPYEVNHNRDNDVMHLFMDMGHKGFGIYVMILGELRLRDHYSCAEDVLPFLARSVHCSLPVIKKVIYNYSLFEIKTIDNQRCVTSVYLNRVMQALDLKRQKLSEAGKKGSDIRYGKELR